MFCPSQEKDVMGSLMSSSYHCVVVGLDGSGKTAILKRLINGQFVKTYPTVGFNCETLKTHRASFQMWDVAGRERPRPLWRSYLRGTDVVLFVIDFNDKDRLDEARMELLNVLKFTKTASTPVLVVASKTDLSCGFEKRNFMEGLDNLDITFFSAFTGDGMKELLENLENFASKRLRKTPLIKLVSCVL